MTTAEWQAKSEADTSAMGRSRRVISNLDYHSAREQHIRCGRPLDEPVRDPVWIEQQYKAGCAALGRVEHQDMDYPYECTFELEERKEKWMTDSKVRKFSEILSASNQKQSEINRPRKAALLTKMVEKRGFAELLTSESEHGAAAGADGAVLFPFMRPAEPSPAAAKKAKKKGAQAAPPTAKGKKRGMTDVIREAEAVEENAAAARPKAAKSKKQEEMLQMVTKMNQ
jgi:hypothetical protein